MKKYLKGLMYRQFCPTPILVTKFKTYVQTNDRLLEKNEKQSKTELDQNRLVIQLPDEPLAEEEWTKRILREYHGFGTIENLSILQNIKNQKRTSFLRYLTKGTTKQALNASINYPRCIANKQKRKAAHRP